jgi:dTDP-glucose 4,6-dehydratase
MNILVTGGAGFIGSNLVHYLLGEALEEMGVQADVVINLDNLTYAGNPSNLDPVKQDPRHVFVHGDVLDKDLVGKLLREHRIDAVMHLAAESHVDRSIESPEPFLQTNTIGTLRLLEEFRSYLTSTDRMPKGGLKSLKDGGTPCFLHVSTDEVYGSLMPSDPPFSETTPYSPNSPYSASKAASDHLARAYHHTYGMPVITTNCSNNYGPYQFPEKLIPLMIRKAVRGEPLPVYGDGQNVRDWLYVRDHCRGLVTALWKGIPGETYVIGGKCEMKNLDVVKAIIATVRELSLGALKATDEEMITFVKDRPGHDQRYAISPDKIARELGWSPAENFATGLRKTVQWYLDQQDWIEAIESGSYRGERLGVNV